MTAAREIGQYRDAHLEIEKLVRAAGPVLESFVQERIKLDVPFYHQTGPDLRHRLTGRTIEEEMAPAELRKRSPHGFADWEPVTQEQVMHETIENACLRPSPASLAKLHKALGGNDARYYEILKQWNTDPARMLPGERPGYVEKKSGGKSDGAASQNRGRDLVLVSRECQGGAAGFWKLVLKSKVNFCPADSR